MTEWNISDPTDQPCIHRTPNAAGSVASELHGVCIFCWRDRAGSLKEALRLSVAEQDRLREKLAGISTMKHKLVALTKAAKAVGYKYEPDVHPLLRYELLALREELDKGESSET